MTEMDLDTEVPRGGDGGSAHLFAEVRVNGAQGEEADGKSDEEEIVHGAIIAPRRRAT